MFKLFANQIWKFKTLLPNGLVVSMTQECSTTVVYVLSLNEVTSMASYWVIHNGHVRYIFSIWCLASVVVLVLFSWPLSYSTNIQAPRLTPPFFFCAHSRDCFFLFLGAPSQLHAVLFACPNIVLGLRICSVLLCKTESEQPQRQQTAIAVDSVYL